MIGKRNEAARARARYLRRVRRLLPEKGGEQRRLLAGLSRRLDGELPEAGYDALTERFGPPEEVAASYVEGYTAQELLRAFRRRRRISRIVAAAALVFVLGIASLAGYFIKEIEKANAPGHIYSVVSYENLSDEELQAIIENSPQFREAMEKEQAAEELAKGERKL